ncbi:MAG: hypothetical protein PF518_08535 [Spirochaetaceae bacterium]|jgi:outer membrane protein assembly factor BamD (BamD/ComL family)|nr:hypothetical protein [Spirochaetaceae bacterium]
MKKINYSLVLLPLLLLFLFSCSSVPTEIDNSIKEELFFKNAQEAMDNNQYNVALYYYEVYLVRYPENHAKVIAAEYERALIYYKTKDYEYSDSLFKQVLKQYESSPFAMTFPERYKILSEKILLQIDQKLNPPKKNKEKQTS